MRFLFVPLLCCACASTPEPDTSAPRDVLELTVQYFESGQYDKLLGLTAPQDRDLQVIQMLGIGEVIARSAGHEDEWQKVLKKHRIDMQKEPSHGTRREIAADFLGRANREKLFSDTVRFALRHDKQPIQDARAVLRYAGRVQVRGDKAALRLEGRNVLFRKIDGRWYTAIDLK